MVKICAGEIDPIQETLGAINRNCSMKVLQRTKEGKNRMHWSTHDAREKIKCTAVLTNARWGWRTMLLVPDAEKMNVSKLAGRGRINSRCLGYKTRCAYCAEVNDKGQVQKPQYTRNAKMQT